MLLFELVHVRLQLLQVLKLSILSEGMVPTDHLDPLEVCQQRPKSIHMQGLLCLHEVAYFLHASAPCGHRSGVPGMCARAWTPKDLDSPSAHLRVKTGNSASRTGTQGPHMACCSVVKDESVTGDQHGTHVATINRSAGSPCIAPGKRDAATAISGSMAISPIPGKDSAA